MCCAFYHKYIFKFILFLRFYLFIFRGRGREGGGEGREKERERNMNMWLPLAHPQPGTWPTTQACALTGNQTGSLLVRRLVFNPLNHTSQGSLQPHQGYPFSLRKWSKSADDCYRVLWVLASSLPLSWQDLPFHLTLLTLCV